MATTWPVAAGTGLVSPVVIHEALAANRTYYVRTDGSNSNTGLVNNAGGAFLTPQYAMDVVAAIDFNGFTVTIQLADGTYDGFSVRKTVGQAVHSDLLIVGNTSTPSNVVIDGTGAGISVWGLNSSACRVKAMKFTGAGTFGILGEANSYIQFENTVFASTGIHVISRFGGFVTATENYTVAASATAHFYANAAGVIAVDTATVTVTGTPAWGWAFAVAISNSSIFAPSLSFSGGATGGRYACEINGVVNTDGGGANYFPGDVPGYTATGGQYF